MNNSKVLHAETLRGPFDPGGQPLARTGQPLEVSLFGWNAQGGMSPNLAALDDLPRFRDYWQWPIARELLVEAESYGFDHQVQFGIWSGWGGPSGWNDAALDFATAAAASAVATERMGLFSTIHLGYRFHPLHVAKITATIDHVSGGRAGINIVAGANPADFRKFGFEQVPPSAERYDLCDEFTTLMKYLWTSEVPVTFEGKYFQAYEASLAPRPTRRPRPVLMNAGYSDAGLDFACRNCEWIFVAPSSTELGAVAEKVEAAHALAAKYGRTVRVATSVYAVMEETDAASARAIEQLEATIDTVAVRSFIDSQRLAAGREASDPSDPYAELGREVFTGLGMGMGSFQLFGGYETVAETMRSLSEAGVEHLVMGFWEPARGIRQMGEHVFPLLRQMGIRQ